MKQLTVLLLLLSIFAMDGCKDSDEPTPPDTKAELIQLDLVVDGSTFNTTIDGTTVTLSRKLPFGTESVNIQTISTSKNASTTLKLNDELTVGETPISIVVKNNTTGEEKTYSLTLTTRDYASVVGKHGLLHVSGNKIVNKNEEVVSFAGSSFFWSNNNWGGERYYTPGVVSWLALDFNTTIVRAAMGVEDDGGYLDDMTANKNRVKTIVDAAISEGLYVIIDWHSHHAEDSEEEAIAFFQEIATTYGDYDNVIYEIYNEPLNISWSDVIKPYAENVIAAIREIDEDNLIIVGTPEWSQRVDLAAADPITEYTNIAYTLHFYSVNHKQWLRDRADAAMEDGIALFATEWGSIGYTQADAETEAWMTWCKENNSSHCNWSVNDKLEEWSILTQGAGVTGHWPDGNLTEAGKLSRRIIRSWE